MSERDLLMMHVDALRERSLVAGESGEPRATEQRIVQTLRARRRRKQRVFWAVSCAALALPLASTTYALVYGTPAALRALLSRVGLGAEVSEQRELPRVSSPSAKPAAIPEPTPQTAETPPANEPSAVVAVPIEPDARPPTEPPTTAPRGRSGGATRSAPTRARESAPRVSAREPAAGDSGESAEALARGLYARAHELHFIARDADSALRAWDDYLARAPLHPLRIEAEYNRALCLVRLGRDEEALRELAHFADGTYGAYRRREATALVRALSR